MSTSNSADYPSFRALVISILILISATPLAAQLASSASSQKFFPDSQYGVSNRYIVLLPRTTPTTDVAVKSAQLTALHGGQVEIRWKRALRGFLATMNAKQAQKMAQDSGVVAVYQARGFDEQEAFDLGAISNLPYCYFDSMTHNSSQPSSPQMIDCADPDPSATGCVDNWGLDRIDDFSVPEDTTWAWDEAGDGIKIYIQDLGVFADHDDFAGGVQSRVKDGIDATFIAGQEPDCDRPAGGLLNGHGTHVSAIAGGNVFGVAKNSSLIPVRHFSLDSTGVCGDLLCDEFIINALECILEDHPETTSTAVVNLSGLNGTQWAGNGPIQEAIIGVASRDNILYVQAAGNFHPSDACDLSFGDESAFPDPDDAAAIGRILVAGGSDEDDGVWTNDGDENPTQTGSDLGPCVDLFAPAAHIVAAWSENTEDPLNEPNAGYCRLTGTSMAAPHVAGVAALMLSTKPDTTAPEVRGDLLDHALRGAMIFDPSEPIEATSPNRLLHYDTNRIFFNGFHHDLSRWWLGGNAGALSHCDWTGTLFGGGTTALCVELGGASAWVEDRRPKDEPDYDFYFRYDFSNITLTTEHTFFEGRNAQNSRVFRLKVRLAAASSEVEIGFFAFNNSGIEAGAWVEAPATQGYVRGSWETATNATFSGFLGFSPEGFEVLVSAAIGNNTNLSVTEVRLGAMGAGSATGTQRFRQFRSWKDQASDYDVPAFDP